MLPSFVAQFTHFPVHRHPPRDRHRTPHRTLRLDFPSPRCPLLLADFQFLNSIFQQAKKQLIATLANSKFELTRTNKRLSNFLIATKTALLPVANSLCRCRALLPVEPRGVANSAREWPGRTTRVRMGTRLLLLKFFLGDTPGLQDRACSLFYLAGPK